MTIQRPVEGAADRYNVTTKTWPTYAPVRGEFVSQSGREYERAAAVRVEMTHLIRIRWREGVDETMRVKFGSRKLYILFVENVKEAGREMLLYCAEKK